MDDVTRRRMLLGTVAVASMSAGCLSDDEAQGAVSDRQAADETVDLLRAAQTIVGESPTGRTLISNEDRTIYVDPDAGDDSAAGTESDPLQTVQEAVDRVPIYLRHQYTIDLATVPDTPVTYNENVLVPSFIATGQAGQEGDAPRPGPFFNLVIRGETGSPESVRLGSILFANVIGVSAAQLRSATITRDSPYDNESHGVSAYGTGEVNLYNITFTDGPTNGVLSYGAKMKASLIDFGDRNVEFGIHGKRHASIMTQQLSGAVTRAAFNATENSMICIRGGNEVTGDQIYRTVVGGLVFDEETGQWTGGTTQFAAPQSGDNAEAGTIWYADGSGDREEGFYGQVRDGSVRLG